MADKTIEADRFGQSLTEILDRLGAGVQDRMPEAIHTGVKRGAVAWRRQIRDEIYGDDRNRTYRKHGKTYTVGAYAKSIRSHMTRKDGPQPAGEVGAPRMPGLPHLLEFGHARVGGGRVRAIPHIGPAADEAFEATEEAVTRAIDEAIHDA